MPAKVNWNLKKSYGYVKKNDINQIYLDNTKALNYISLVLHTKAMYYDKKSERTDTPHLDSCDRMKGFLFDMIEMLPKRRSGDGDEIRYQ